MVVFLAYYNNIVRICLRITILSFCGPCLLIKNKFTITTDGGGDLPTPLLVDTETAIGTRHDYMCDIVTHGMTTCDI